MHVDIQALNRSLRHALVNSLVVASRGTIGATLSQTKIPAFTPAVPLQGLPQVLDIVLESLFHRVLRFPAEIFLGPANVEMLGA